MIQRFAIVPLLALLAGCSSQHSMHSATPVAPATAEQEQALLGQMKTLEGTWAMKGSTDVATTYAVSSNGSVVREIMFPGSKHEMTNVYHMDGPSLLMTHYCAEGNQPRMRATRNNGGSIAFGFDGVSNLTSENESCMRELTIEIKDHDHLVQHWKSYEGPTMKHEANFEFTRLK